MLDLCPLAFLEEEMFLAASRGKSISVMMPYEICHCGVTVNALVLSGWRRTNVSDAGMRIRILELWCHLEFRAVKSFMEAL